MHSYRNQNVKDLSSNQIKRINSISKIFNLSRAICVLFFKEGWCSSNRIISIIKKKYLSREKITRDGGSKKHHFYSAIHLLIVFLLRAKTTAISFNV